MKSFKNNKINFKTNIFYLLILFVMISIIKDPALYVRESIMKNSSLKMKDIAGATIEPMELYQRITKEFNFFKDTHNNPIEKGTIWIK